MRVSFGWGGGGVCVRVLLYCGVFFNEGERWLHVGSTDLCFCVLLFVPVRVFFFFPPFLSYFMSFRGKLTFVWRVKNLSLSNHV